MDEAYQDDAPCLSKSSSDIPDSAHGIQHLFTILPRPHVGHAKWAANHIPLLAKLLSQQNRQLPLEVLHCLAQGEDNPMHSVHFDDTYHMQNAPEKPHLPYLIN